jgi:hypothetical protein
VEPADLEEALEDLETRLERLRALYEQYFLGIEKVPPAVARADVDRRIWALRKVQIRNTAKRYKLQTIVQRYNTFQQYWARICREIEDGTYSPHVARARKQLDADKALTIATRRRLGMYRRSSSPPADDARGQALREAESELTAALAQPEQAASLADAWKDPREKLSPGRAAASNVDGRKARTAPAASSAAGAWRDPREKPPVHTTSSVPQRPGAPSPLPPHRPEAVSNTRSDLPDGRARSSRPQRSPAGPVGPLASIKPAIALEPVTLQFAPQPPTPRPPTRAVSQFRPQAAEAQALAKALPPTPAERPPAQRGTGLTTAGVEQLHRQLVEARRRNNDEGNVDLDALRSRLEKTERQLRSQHGNRPIEFAVVVKNGRAMIKPTVR